MALGGWIVTFGTATERTIHKYTVSQKVHRQVSVITSSNIDERGRQTTMGLSTTAVFSVFAGCIFGNFRDNASIMIYGYGVPRNLSLDPKTRDLE